MGQFDKIAKYKNNIMLKLTTDTNLIKALVINDEDFLRKELPSEFNPSSLIYNQIFPYQHMIENDAEELKTYICVSFGDYRYINNVFKSGKLTFFIFTYKTLMQTDIGSRTDYILDQIDSMFNNKENSDIGSFTLELNNGGDFNANKNYLGSMVSYKFIDFQNV